MSGKSKHGKGKHLHRSKKNKAKYRHGAMAVPQPVAADSSIPAATTTAHPAPSAPAPPEKPVAVRHPYITTELRRIAILAGIILVILIVLAQVLS